MDEGYDPASIRHLLISSHYRGELNFTRRGLQASGSAVQRLLDFEHRLEEVPINDLAEGSQLPSLARSALDSFTVALDNDFNSADALAVIFVMVSEVNAELDLCPAVIEADRDQVLKALRSMDGVLGLLEVAHTSRVVDDEVTTWVKRKLKERAKARADGEYAAADAIREELEKRGILVEDSPTGTRWKVVG